MSENSPFTVCDQSLTYERVRTGGKTRSNLLVLTTSVISSRWEVVPSSVSAKFRVACPSLLATSYLQPLSAALHLFRLSSIAILAIAFPQIRYALLPATDALPYAPHCSNRHLQGREPLHNLPRSGSFRFRQRPRRKRSPHRENSQASHCGTDDSWYWIRGT